MQEKQQLAKQQKPGELFFLIILFAIVGAFFVEAAKLKGLFQGTFNGPGTIPQLIVVVMTIMICLHGYGIYKKSSFSSEPLKIIQYLFSINVIALLIMVVLYAFLLEILHFKLTTFFFLFLLMYFFDRKRPLQKLAVSLGTLGFIIVIFAFLFEVVLP
jgi:hypothetical protein